MLSDLKFWVIKSYNFGQKLLHHDSSTHIRHEKIYNIYNISYITKNNYYYCSHVRNIGNINKQYDIPT